MSRLFTQPAEQATGHTAEIFTNIRKAIGMVPNAYAAIGNNSPVALEAALNLDGALRKGSLSAKDIEAVKLAVSQRAACDYCLAAHTLAGRKAGIPADSMTALRRDEATGDARTDALVHFVHTLVSTSGTVPEAAVRAVQAAGVTDAQIVDVLLAIASITFTNLFNRVNDTALDFPAAPAV
jgi:uncharacterized peroxidase-related enzyme